MGSPSEIMSIGSISTWYYNRSTINFINEKVTGWDNSGGNLVLEQTTTNEVRAIMGTPSTIMNIGSISTWYYDKSTINFTNEKVTGWDNRGNLELEQMTTNEGTFYIGSTANEVRVIMGTPSTIMNIGSISTWYYDRSTIIFTNEKVTGWDNSGDNLKLE